jgi:hypothetical protein
MTSVLASGTAATITPVVSGENDFTGPQVIAALSAGTALDEINAEGIPFAALDGKLYHRSTPDAGSDNVVSSRYILKQGWK